MYNRQLSEREPLGAQKLYAIMQYTIYDRLLRREVATSRNKPYSSVLGLYGDRQWIKDMDIVNELEGHNGCVNALRYRITRQLSWSLY